MKLMRVGDVGHEKPCVLDAGGFARDVSSVVNDFTPDTIDGLLETLSAIALTDLPVVSMQDQRIGTPMAQPRNIYCIGLNYSDFVAEADLEMPKEPLLLGKSACTFCGPNDPIIYSPKMKKLDWEVELGVVIGKTALNIKRDKAMDYILGYTLVNDITERAWQLERGGQWGKGKGFPNFNPTGPWLVTADEVGDTGGLSMWLDVNGKRMQTGNTKTMIFDVATIVAHLSEFIRLDPGDLICTGTPPGVGMGKIPPQYLAIGDVVTLGVDGLGEQKQTVVALSQ